MKDLIIDAFAGGGGASVGIEMALGRPVVSIRDKKRKGKKLEKWEQEYYKNNKSIVDLHLKSTQRSDAEKAELRELFGLNK